MAKGKAKAVFLLDMYKFCSASLDCGEVGMVKEVLSQTNRLQEQYVYNCTDLEGRALVHYASVRGDLGMVRVLAELGADMTIQDDGGATALMLAARSGLDKVVQLLLMVCPLSLSTVNERNGWSVLHYACAGGSVCVVRRLVSKYKVSCSVKDHENNTPLHVAACTGNEMVAFSLIEEFHCDPTIVGYCGRSLLHCACQGGSVPLVQTLVQKYKGSVNARDDLSNMPLHLAAANGNVGVVFTLIKEFHCDQRVKGYLNRSLLHYACQADDVDQVHTLIEQSNADINARDDQNNTPLSVAAAFGNTEVALCLIREFGCNPNVRGQFGRSVLHHACEGGSVSLVKTLIREHNVDVNARDEHNNTPLIEAASIGKVEVALCLIREFGSDPNVRGQYGRSVLHHACEGGSVSLVKTLIREHNVDVNARDEHNNTTLNVAAFCGKAEVALCLIRVFGCDPNVSGEFGRSVLHHACEGGSVSLVQTLIQEHKADVNVRDEQNSTPLNVAAFCGKAEVTLCLISEFGCDPNVRNRFGRSVLHNACEGGSVSLVQNLIRKYQADTNCVDDRNNTPLYIAAYHGKVEVAMCLINEFGCAVKPAVKDQLGDSLLHHACFGGSVDLVKFLIEKHKEDVNARNDQGNTPLCYAAVSGSVEVALLLIEQFGCDTNVVGYLGKSVLHYACQGGSLKLVQSLIQEHHANVTTRDKNSYTPLHTAAYYGMADIALFLIDQFGCDIHAKGYEGQSLLHCACEGGSVRLVQSLLHTISVLSIDNEGNTPLHTCSSHGRAQCVEALLSLNAPVLIRNNNGKTPVDVAIGRSRTILDQYLVDNHHKLQVDYNVVLKLAKERYSGEHPLARLFVVGNPGAGKSSLVESLKTEGGFRFLIGISESSVPPHTAGIVPSIHHSQHHGRVMFYDFAGDPEYYSSHAAILENLASSKVGDNLIIIVVDLTAIAVTINTTLEYWLSFIEHQKFKAKINLAIAGSHSDLLPRNQVGTKKALLQKSVRPYPFIEEVRCFTLDCRKPRSEGMVLLRNQIYMWTSMSPQYRLSEKASLLLGIFEKDFGNVTACSLETILSHIRDCGVCLPTDAGGLYLILSQLHDIGVLLLLGDHTRNDFHVVLKCSKLTIEVHKLLFSRSAVENLQQKFTGVHDTTFNIGILPESVLKEILPPYITPQCLSCLLYCQEIKHGDINAFVSGPPLPTNQSFFIFPALCTIGKSDVTWVTPPTYSYSIGWLARCTAPSDCFPPRFIHVLLLRLVYRFTLSVPGASPDLSLFQRRCTTWKTGVHWLMREGVECMVELVNSNKGVAVITKADTDSIDNCVSVFHRVISCVMEAKAEFCHSIRPQFFLLDSTSEAEFHDEDKLFAMNEVEEVLTTTEGPEAVVVSVNGKGVLKRERFIHLRKLTLWDSIFPIEFLSILQYLKALVTEVYELGLVLKVSVHHLETLSCDFPTDTSRRRRELVRVWLSSSLEPPCWLHLVRALRTEMVGRKDLAQSIERDLGKLILWAFFCKPCNVCNCLGDVIGLQEKLLASQYHDLKPDVEFLESFAGVVGSKWPSLAASLFLNDEEIGEVRKDGGSPQDCARQTLNKWSSREDATYGQLCQMLVTISLFH